jgi:hypothetical protein
MEKIVFFRLHHINTMQAQVIGFCLMVIKGIITQNLKFGLLILSKLSLRHSGL